MIHSLLLLFNICIRNISCCLLLVGVLLSCRVLIADNLYVDRIGLENGLSQNTITAITQDTKGFMWFGTQDGLSRYDGYSFKKYGYEPDDPWSLSDNNVWSIDIDKEEMLWVGTLAGLNRFDIKTERFTHFQHEPGNVNSISDNSLQSVYVDSRNTLWVGTRNGLNIYDSERNKFKRYFHNSENNFSLNNNSINEIFEDAEGDLWVATDSGINQYDVINDRFIRLENHEALLKNILMVSIGEDRHGHLWFGSLNDGVFVYDKQKKKVIANYKHYVNKPGSLSSDNISVIYKDRNERMWVGTVDAGLNMLDEKNNKFLVYRTDAGNMHSLSDDNVVSLYEDATGVLWIGTYTNGLSKFNPYSFSMTLVSNKKTPYDADPLMDARAFVVDQHKEVWVASSYNGIKVSKKDGQLRHYKHDNKNKFSISNNRVYSLYEDKSGVIWAGAAKGVLNRYDRKLDGFIRYDLHDEKNKNYRHDEIKSIVEDNLGMLWVASNRGGAHRFNRDTGKFVHYHSIASDPMSISSNEVFYVYEDRNKTLWLAAFPGGLNRYNPETDDFKVYRHDPDQENSIGTDFVISIDEDIHHDGVLWIGLYGVGFDRFDSNTESFKHYGREQGLIDSGVYAVIQDYRGLIWISHNKGLSRFDPELIQFLNYDKRDGLQSNEFNGGAAYRAADGKLYFGGIAGYNAFYPDDIVANPYVPPVYITEFKLFNKEVSVNQKYNGRILLPKTVPNINKLELTYRDYIFSFAFAGLDFASPSKNQYAYMMEGLENKWNYVDSKRRFATYTTLSPGEYRFRVKASNNNGVWNEQGVNLSISIAPPFWETAWFRLVCGLLIIIFIYLFYRLRVRAIRLRNTILEKEVKARTEELQEEKSILENTLLELSETKDALIESARKAGMAEIATGVLHNVGNLLNSVVTSAGMIREIVKTSVLLKFLKVSDLIAQNRDNLIEYLDKDAKGKKLPEYLINLAEPIKYEQKLLLENSDRLFEKIDSIKETITAQQRFAEGSEGFYEMLSLKDMVEDSLLLQSGSIGRHEIEIVRRFDDSVPKLKIQKAKFMQILVNFYKNAKESMDANKNCQSVLTIEIYNDDSNVYVSYTDTGLGIEKDNLHEIFAHGYTTKEDGHGFGLHSCANYMAEMGGKLWAESEGSGLGAKFIVSFPLKISKTDSSESSSENNLSVRKIA